MFAGRVCIREMKYSIFNLVRVRKVKREKERKSDYTMTSHIETCQKDRVSQPVCLSVCSPADEITQQVDC